MTSVLPQSAIIASITCVKLTVSHFFLWNAGRQFLASKKKVLFKPIFFSDKKLGRHDLKSWKVSEYRA